MASPDMEGLKHCPSDAETVVLSTLRVQVFVTVRVSTCDLGRISVSLSWSLRRRQTFPEVHPPCSLSQRGVETWGGAEADRREVSAEGIRLCLRRRGYRYTVDRWFKTTFPRGVATKANSKGHQCKVFEVSRDHQRQRLHVSSNSTIANTSIRQMGLSAQGVRWWGGRSFLSRLGFHFTACAPFS